MFQLKSSTGSYRSALAGCLLVTLHCVTHAQAPAPVPAASTPAPAATASAADAGQEALTPCPTHVGMAAAPALEPELARTIRDRVAQRTGSKPQSVCRMPFGLYEVIADGEVLYVDERVNYLLAGNAFDMRTQENLTSARREEALRVDFKSLPLEKAVKTVRGDGSRPMVVFEDPNCPYCKRFEHDMATLNNTTIYTFLYPILSRDHAAPDDSYPKSRAIWCAPDRTAAWSQLMLEGRRLAPAADSCEHPLEEILTLGQKLHVTGTPTIIFTDGRRAPGAIPLDKVEKMLAESSTRTASK